MNDRWLIYGVSGYTGKLVARAAHAAALAPTLAGRSEAKVRDDAEALGLPWQAFALSSVDEITRRIAGHELLLNCAGPFSATSSLLVEACLRAGVHYLDITGEAPVFQAIYARDEEARRRKVLLLPGVGCDVVASNSLAAILAERLPDAHRLELAVSPAASPSRGVLKTMVTEFPEGGLVVRSGEPLRVPHAYCARRVPFAEGKSSRVVSAPWGDLPSAQRATGIPDVTVYMEAPRLLIFAMKLLPGLLASAWVRGWIYKAIDRLISDPNESQRSHGRMSWWAEVENPSGARLSGRIDIRAPDTFTANAAVASVARVLAGGVPVGAQTPAMAFGATFATKIAGSRLTLFESR